MRGLDIGAENLKNQQEVVKNEVKVNVLNQPYGGFPWIDLPMAANENWYNAHNFYGDLAAPRRGDARRRHAVLQDVLRAEQRRARGRRRLRPGAGEGAGSRSTSATSRRRRCRRPPTCASRGRRRRSAPAAPTRSPTVRRSASPTTCPSATRRSGTRSGLIDQLLAQGQDSLLYDELVRKQGLTGDVERRHQLGPRQHVRLQGARCSGSSQFFHDADVPSDKLLAAFDTAVGTAARRRRSTRPRSIARS